MVKFCFANPKNFIQIQILIQILIFWSIRIPIQLLMDPNPNSYTFKFGS